MHTNTAPFALEAKSPMIELTAEEAARVAGAGYGFEYTTIEESSHIKFGWVDPNYPGERLEFENIDYDTQTDVAC